MNEFLILLVVLACWRTTRIFTDDFILQPLRDFLDRKIPYLGYQVSCPFCIGFWIAAAYAYLLWEFAGLSTVEALVAWPALNATTLFTYYVLEWIDGNSNK